MPLEDTIQFLKQTQKNVLATTEGVRKAKEAYSELENEIRSAKNKLKYKKSTRHADTHARNVIRALKSEKELKGLLMAEIDDALIRSGREFQEYEDVYKSHLYEVANNDDIYLIVPLGAGWATTISPQIIFENAGTLTDYARGIEEFRISLNVKVGQEGSGRGTKATSWWMKNVYGDEAKYKRTIEKRIQYSGRPAPFWSLIAHGSASLPSDRPDGSYNPLPAGGVNFVMNTEESIKKRFKSLMDQEKSAWEKETQEFEEEIRLAERYKQRFLEGLEQLTTEFEKNQITLQRFGEYAQYVDEDRLAMAARRLRADEQLESKTIELGVAGRSYRPKVRTLEGRLEY